ncbi:hypothetical protein F2Q69_00037277 [Brassica cretica]|uniref:Reverse transcriptase zinc-binding domain-containing protein n=1 Tax=Brassica cretica TaxID=69181 RepID=A0A8S9SFD0_BRACR|nr:hypothetical protein F2Q69_00037277 [Brassica cretica]
MNRMALDFAFIGIKIWNQTNLRSRIDLKLNKRSATVVSLYDHDHWLLPPARSENQLDLQVYLTTVNLSDEQDQYEWEVAGQTSSCYSTGEVYTYLKGPAPLVPWTQLQLHGSPRNKDLRRLTLLAVQGTIYWLWHERNTRLHQQTFRTAEAIFSTIDKQLWNRVQSFRHTNPRASTAMMQLWFLRS